MLHYYIKAGGFSISQHCYIQSTPMFAFIVVAATVLATAALNRHHYTKSGVCEVCIDVAIAYILLLIFIDSP